MRRRGSILIIVLWALFILGALAVATSGYVAAQINLSGKLSERSRGYYLAKAGVERAIFEVRNDTSEMYDAFTDNWGNNNAAFKEAPLGDGTYSVLNLSDTGDNARSLKYGLSDEESKININKAPKDILKNFFVIAGDVSEEDAGAIAASIINWRSPAERAEKEGMGEFHYQTLDRPYKAKNAPMEIPEELLLVSGMTDTIFNKIKSRITLYGDGAVNINTADEIVFRSIGMSEELAAKVVHFRGERAKMTPENIFDDPATITMHLKEKESISGTDDNKIQSLITARLLSVTSDNFGGIAVGNVGKKNSDRLSAKISFIFDRKKNIIRYWRE